MSAQVVSYQSYLLTEGAVMSVSGTQGIQLPTPCSNAAPARERGIRMLPLALYSSTLRNVAGNFQEIDVLSMLAAVLRHTDNTENMLRLLLQSSPGQTATSLAEQPSCTGRLCMSSAHLSLYLCNFVDIHRQHPLLVLWRTQSAWA